MFKKMAILALLILLLSIALVVTAAVFYNIGADHGLQTGERMFNPKKITLVGRSATNSLTDVENVLVALPGDRYFSLYVGNAFTDNSISISVQTPLSGSKELRKLRALPTAGGALIIFEVEQTGSIPSSNALPFSAETQSSPNEILEATR